MTEERKDLLTRPTRYGKVLYETNPSISGGGGVPVKITPRKPSPMGGAFMIAPDTGEVMAKGTFGFIEETEVDAEKFVKVYLDGIRQFGQLAKAGSTLFEIVYRELSGPNGRDKDTIMMNFYLAQRYLQDMSRRTYERGMNELLEKEFLYRSVVTDMYFVNVRYMFNGDRMVVVKAYRRKGSRSDQPELPFESTNPVQTGALERRYIGPRDAEGNPTEPHRVSSWLG